MTDFERCYNAMMKNARAEVMAAEDGRSITLFYWNGGMKVFHFDESGNYKV